MDANKSEIKNIEKTYEKNRLPELLSVSQVADFFGVHSGTVRRWEKAGLLQSYSIGLRRNLRFKQEDVLSFLHKTRERSTGGTPLCTTQIRAGPTG
jgi:excisionase family DNA binding protein